MQIYYMVNYIYKYYMYIAKKINFVKQKTIILSKKCKKELTLNALYGKI